ncbi:hypothetical protein [Glaciimonas immobilis]|uniref:Uncharacterized protein n=1 Tax=Glaciimonas immobilis TaxID=728004 RepID=A0A840RRM2_9BURK|nr:hypothetical protein [Glaciimonas immobilis]KAF3999926.1 hypothetical protein HAV38_01745 [Glaciimonas immobilis]MBB5200425.1 hypothetical protein [Glaciimonas immobilis]
MNNKSLDAGIPLLTEVITPVEEEHVGNPPKETQDTHTANHPEENQHKAMQAKESPPADNQHEESQHLEDDWPTLSLEDAITLSDDGLSYQLAYPALLPLSAAVDPKPDWGKLEQDLHQKILGQLQDRIDLVIEQRIRDSLAGAIETAIQGLTDQIKAGLHQTLNEVVSQAVAIEVTKFQKTKYKLENFD